jgi:hypothetical protein
MKEREGVMTICNILAFRYSDCKKEIDQTSDPIEIQKLEDELEVLEKIMKFKKCM